MLSSSSPLQLTLIIPGLAQALEAVAGEEFRLPWLERLVGRSNSKEAPLSCDEALLFVLFDLWQPDAKDVPLAAVMYPWDKGCDRLPPGWWLRADPVYLRADRDRLLLFGSRYFELSMAEAEALANRVAPLLAEFGGQLEVLYPDRWYLRLPQPEAVTFTALSAIEGKRIESGLPSGSKSARWRALLNEIQMTLHDCPANREREDRGAWPVNSLWFWGAGEAPTRPASRWQRVEWGREPLLQALATYCGIPGQSAPADANTWLAQNPTPGNYLLMLDTLAHATEPVNYRAALLALEKNWFEVLYKALQRRHIASLEFYPGDGRSYRLTWPRSWHLWRRSRSLTGMNSRFD